MPPEDPVIPSDTPQNLDATATSADRASQSLLAMGQFADDAHESLGQLNTMGSAAQKTFGIFDDSLKKFGVSLNNTQSLTEQQTTQFGLLSIAILGAKKSFDNFSNIDTGNLSTFTSQIEYMVATFGTGEGGIAKLVGALQNGLGIAIPKSAQSSVKAVRDFAAGLVISADNALRVQNAYIQLSAKTGNLSEVYAAAGPNLENLNALLEKQTAMISNSVKATGLAPEVVQKYYSELGSIPKALESNVKSTGGATQSISMLTASIKLATGTGRNYVDIIDDMKVAFKNYNLTGEDALQFTARISEISNKFGVNLDVVRSSLRGTAETFKMFGNEAGASARILNEYVGALQSTGLSGDAAVDVVTSMTGAVGQLGIAQKAFLSAQTGGSGGLMGAFQIDKLMREGKLDQVFDKVRQQMMKQFGNIVTVDEAAKSPAAAAQMTRQMMLLRQGPLGQFAKSDMEAERVLEGFRAKQEGRVSTTGLDPKIVQTSMDKGTLIQEKSYTELTRIRGALEGARGAADISNLGFVQEGLAASTGTKISLTPSQERSKTGLKGFMEESALEGGKTAADYARDISTKSPIGDTGRRAVTAITEFQKMFKDIPESMKAPLDALKNALVAGKTMNINLELQSLKAEIDKAKSSASKTQAEQIYQAAVEGYEAMGVSVDGASSLRKGIQIPGQRPLAGAAGRVGVAANRASAGPGMAQRSIDNATVGAAPGLEKPRDITVNISVSDDRVTYKVSPNTTAVNPASTR